MHALVIFSLSLLCSVLPCTEALAQSFDPYSYDEGTPSVVDYYVSGTTGSDSNSGLSESQPFRTVKKVWDAIVRGRPLTTGVRINLLNGNYGDEELPNYWEDRQGTYAAPIILRAAPGHDRVVLVRDINMAGVSYFYLLNLEITPRGGGDTFHCERCDHLLIRGTTLNGGSLTQGAHETVKINQSQYVYLENNNISFADDNNIDFVGVQYGHIIGNKIHSAQDWCMYVKGGSAYLRIESNEIYNCGTGGFTAGQGSGFQFMTSPWTQYEAYDIKFVNNIVHTTAGAAFGTNGGYNILLAHNSAYNVGSRSHLLEVVFGERTCDGERNGAPNAECASRNGEGGWGAASTATDPDPIGNRNVYVLNNLIVNSSTVTSPQHFAIYGPRTARSGTNIQSPQHSDTNLIIQGNVIVNGGMSTPLGVEDTSSGCQPSNPTCTAEQIARDNTINGGAVSFQNPSSGDLRPVAGDPVFGISPVALISFPGGDRANPPVTPEGVLSNVLNRDFSGSARGGGSGVGAFASATSSRTPPSIGDSTTPTGPGGENPSDDTISIDRIGVTQKRNTRGVSFTITATIAGSDLDVTAEVSRSGKKLSTVILSPLPSKKYRGKASLKVRAKTKLVVEVVATRGSSSVSQSKNISSK